ncbi:MAG TPA: hypothetical protein PK129_09585 [Cellvibrionaceae bacterium]|nr:hypothetical protein [Cellvibrionaceae bacterium]
MFANQAAFNDPKSRMQALGQNTRPEGAVVDSRLKPLFYMQTGGMINPQRDEIMPGAILYRFSAAKDGIQRGMTGGWWMHAKEFSIVENFATHNRVGVSMAARILCCVPPEWSDMTLLLRARVREPLLAYKGLGNHVNTTAPDNLARVKMTAHNDIAARRLHQLYIPGLYDYAQKTPQQVMPGALVLEQHWEFTKEEAKKGWVYI